MNFYQFNDSDELEQHEELWENGVHIGERIEGGHKIVLYQIHSFYVELYYHMELNALRRLRSFSSSECLDAYLQQYKINDLLR